MTPLACILCFAFALAMGAQAAEEDSAARFIGSWKLVAYEQRLPSGEVRKPFGDHPDGRILYQKNGQMSAQLMRPGQVPFADADPVQARSGEAESAWRNYIGYWGTFSVDTKARAVVHSIEGGWFPNWIGRKQVRSFRFSGSDLILEADTPAWHATLRWRRVE